MHNRFEVRGETTVIFINHRGETKEFLIDTEDWDKVSAYRWRCNGHGYAYSYTSDGPAVAMSRLVAGTPKGFDCDHINHNILDNRKCNLRNVTRVVNALNRGRPPKNIYLHGGRYCVWLKANGEKKMFGSFDNIEDAKRVAKEVQRRAVAGEVFPGHKYRRSYAGVSGIEGISWNTRKKTWRVMPMVDGRQIYIGSSKSLDEAKRILKDHQERQRHQQVA